MQQDVMCCCVILESQVAFSILFLSPSSFIASYSFNELGLSEMAVVSCCVLASSLLFWAPASPRVQMRIMFLRSQETRSSRNPYFWWLFFLLWGCRPVVIVLKPFANQAKFGEMMMCLPAVQGSCVGAVAVTLVWFKPVLLQTPWNSSSHVSKC